MDLARIVEIAKAQAAANVREVGGANRGRRNLCDRFHGRNL